MRKYGYKKNPPDARDYKYKTPKFRKPPAFSDLKSIVLPIEDQGNLGSCVGNGGTTQLEAMWVKMGRPHTQLSRLMLYWLARYLEGNTENDDGCYPRDMAKAVSKFGVAIEEAWPYVQKKFRDRPSRKAFSNALDWRVDKYYWPRTLDEVKWALARGYPVGVGIPVYSSFMDPKNGTVPMPAWGEENQGGHWIVLCGHNDSTQRMDFANSWGTSWGKDGYGTLPYKFLERYASDYLVLELGKLGNVHLTPDIELPDDGFYIPVISIVNWLRNLFQKGGEKDVG